MHTAHAADLQQASQLVSADVSTARVATKRALPYAIAVANWGQTGNAYLSATSKRSWPTCSAAA